MIVKAAKVIPGQKDRSGIPLGTLLTFRTCTVQFSPWQMLSGGCSPMTSDANSQLTAGSFPLAASIRNCDGSR